MLINHTLVCLDDIIMLAYGGGNCFSFGTHFNGHTLAVHGLATQPIPLQPSLNTVSLADIQLQMDAGRGERLLSKRQPFLVQGNIGWTCSLRLLMCVIGCQFTQHVWNAEYLAATCADKEVSVHVAESDTMDFLTRNFK